MSTQEIQQESTISIRIYAEDVDWMGIVYHGNYIKYLDRGRTEMLRQYNLNLSELMKVDISFIIHKIAIQYKFPAKLDDWITVVTRVDEIKYCGFVFGQHMVNQHDQIICQAKVNVISVNAELKPQRLPQLVNVFR